MNQTKLVCRAALVLVAASTPVTAQAAAGCRASLDRGTLSVFGDDSANIIEIVGTADRVQLTCDGVSASYTGVSAIFLFGGAGDDAFELGHLEGLPHAEPFGQVVDGGMGNDALTILAGSLADRLDIVPGTEAGSVEVQVADAATETPLAIVIGSAIEFLSVKGGDGDDEFRVGGVPGIRTKLFGDSGNDSAGLDVLIANTGVDRLFDWSGGFGHDEFKVIGGKADEHYLMTPALDPERPDPHIQVTDSAGAVVADLFVQETEAIGIEAGDGDDHLDILWDALHMSGLTMFRADLGDGNDTAATNVLPVLVAPPGGEVQTLLFDFVSSRGDDQVTFQHSAGSWFDIAFTARLGTGNDHFVALLFPPPDDGSPGPAGARRLSFEVFAGNDGDVVGLQNTAGNGLIDVFLDTELGRGNDLLEADGTIALVARPGHGIDTARVTPNLLTFVSQFERIEVLEEVR
jgi:hypothetical protein